VPQAQHEIKNIRVERLRVRRELSFVAKGYSERRKSVVIQARKRHCDSDEPSSHIGAGFTATKKIGSAVIRNRAKRRMRECARVLLPKHGLPEIDYVFIARRDTSTRQWQGLLDDVESALLRLREQILSGKPPAPERRSKSPRHGKPGPDKKKQ
jgi:ribonuclease P protein component